MIFDPARRRFAWMVAGALLTFAILAGIRLYRSNNLLQQSAAPPIRFAYQDRIGSALCIVAVEKAFFRFGRCGDHGRYHGDYRRGPRAAADHRRQPRQW
jgi:hypothetical protein